MSMKFDATRKGYAQQLQSVAADIVLMVEVTVDGVSLQDVQAFLAENPSFLRAS